MQTDKRKEQVRAYHKKLDRIIIRIHKDGSSGITREQINAAAAAEGISINQFLIRAVSSACSRAQDEE